MDIKNILELVHTNKWNDVPIVSMQLRIAVNSLIAQLDGHLSRMTVVEFISIMQKPENIGIKKILFQNSDEQIAKAICAAN